MEGTELRNYDLLLRHGLVVVQEINLFVHYCLLAMPGVRAAEVRRVISHPMALAHCGRALARLGVDREPVEDTAGAVEMLRSNRMLDTAAIASPRAADLYDLDVLAHGLQDLQDESWNVTRFLLLSRPSPPPPPAPPPAPSAVAADSPRLNAAGKVVFNGLGRSSSSPSSLAGGRRGHRAGGAMERSYSAHVRVAPVLNVVPVCSLRGSRKSVSVFGIDRLFSPSTAASSSSASAAANAAKKSRAAKKDVTAASAASQ